MMDMTSSPVIQDPAVAERATGARRAHGARGNDRERRALLERYADRISKNSDLSRGLVSFQGNKKVPLHNWFNYKEAFSAKLVRHVIDHFAPMCGHRVLDPFSGAGTTLTIAAKSGCSVVGIELLPVGVAAARARLVAETADLQRFDNHLQRLLVRSAEGSSGMHYAFPHLRITRWAFPEHTERAFSEYAGFLDGIHDESIRFLFWFAWLSVLEEVSYTRKDGQYLRWDARSGRQLKSDFRKREISEFWPAVTRKLFNMFHDMRLWRDGTPCGDMRIIEGSCLAELPLLANDSFDLVVTSPPYCNRYDYTRTYALELAFMGYGERALKELRQALLSATVENKTKRQRLRDEYSLRGEQQRYRGAMTAFESQAALHEVLALLREAKARGALNNSNIPDMVENYFLEMNVVIRELSRVLAPGGVLVMVNDNVRYHGEEVPVDLILSDFASTAGLRVDHVWVLPRGKGNSSQQMGRHGRDELRKCIYVWSKP